MKGLSGCNSDSLVSMMDSLAVQVSWRKTRVTE
eukprot:COSAG05_NODE_24606_length_242_cov_2815.671329_1_plen_32_part_10